jgi:hypothetical protein
VFSDILSNSTDHGELVTSCKSWNSFLGSVSASSISQQLTELHFIFSDGLTSSNDSTLVSCTDTTALTYLQSAFSDGVSMVVTCGDTEWTVSVCDSDIMLCVNCTTETSLTSVNAFGSCFASNLLNSTCNQGSLRRRLFAVNSTSFARLLVTSFTQPEAPVVQALMATGHRTSVVVTATLQSTGLVYCAAFGYSVEPPSSVPDIISYNEVGWTSATSYTLNVTITSLTPASQYYVYCASMTVAGVYSALATAVKNRLFVETTCCRTLTFTLLYGSAFAGTVLTKVASMKVDVLPAEDLKITIVATHGNQNYSFILPDTVTVSATSSATVSFAYAGTSIVAGIYHISVILSGSASGSYDIVFSNGNTIQVLDLDEEPPTPTLASAQFSNDGSAVIVQFDASTDEGTIAGLPSVKVFSCSKLFMFGPGTGGHGVSLARCQWNSEGTAVTAIPSAAHPLYPNNSTVVLFSGLVRAACPYSVSASVCKGWSTAVTVSVVIGTPPIPIIPRVKVSLSNSIGACDSPKLDISGSTGSGGRTWASVNITFNTKASNTSSLKTYLESDHRYDVPIVISNSLLQKGSIYVFSIELCNWLGSCSGSSASVTVLNQILPYVGMTGGPILAATVNATIRLSSLAFIASCDGSHSTLDLQYAWSIAQVSNKTSASSLPVVSTSKDPSKYTLNAFQLTVSTIYSVRLTVTSLQSYKSNSATVTIRVLSSDVIVIISGGSQQSARAGTDFGIDGSGSYDTGQVNNGNVGLAFAWQCSQTSPTYSSSCPMTSEGGSQSASILVLAVPSSAANTTSTVILTVANSLVTARNQVSVTAFVPAVPAVTIVTSFASKVSTTAEIVIQGLVTTAVACDALWVVNDASLHLDIISSVSPTFAVPASTSESAVPLFLSLAASALPIGSSVTFTLSCTDSKTGFSSFAAVDVTTNLAPLPGQYTVSPVAGVALSTSFSFTLSSWVDEDIPLSYQFGFISPISNTSFTIQTKSFLSFASAFLPSGSASANYSLQAEFAIYDSYGAYSMVYATVTVSSSLLDKSAVNEQTSTLLAENDGNVDGLKQTISLITTAVGTVNCSGAPNCTALNRYGCAATANTCGECIADDYVGVSGDSNTACLNIALAASFPGVTVDCGSDEDCSGWMICDSTSRVCVDEVKDCPSSCSDYGACIYQAVNTLEPLSVCTASNPNCVAVCSCNARHYGVDCSLSEIEWQTQLSTTAQLIAALQQVTELEVLDGMTAEFWINSLQSLTANSNLLNDTTVSVAGNITASILSSSLLDSHLLSSSSMVVLADVISNLILFSASNSTGTVAENLALLDLLSVSTTSPLVLGEAKPVLIQTSYRQIASITATGRPRSQHNMSMAIPRTALEIVMDVMPPAVVNISASPLGSAIGATSLPKYLLSSSSWTVAGLNVSSNGVRLNLNQVAVEASCKNATYVDISFAHYEDEYFGVQDNSNETITTNCTAGVASVSTHTCSSGKTLSAYCFENTTEDHYIVSTCPSLMRIPQCKLTSSTAPEDSIRNACTLVSYTSTTTTCRCSLCALSMPSRRLTDSILSTREAATAVALSTYSFTKYASVVESAPQFNSLVAVKSTVALVAAFVTLWLGFPLILCGVEKYKHYVSTQKQGSVVPAAHTHQRATVSGKARVTLDSMKFSSLEDCLRDYISELFSNAFSQKSATTRLAQELWINHQYLRVLSLPFGAEQGIATFSLLTSLTANFFLLAVLYDIQYPTDDGSCGKQVTKEACLTAHSIFNPSESKCVWTSSTASSGTNCKYSTPSFDIFTTVIVTIIVLLVSSPLTMGIAWVCNEVLAAPSLSETKLQESNVRVIRASALIKLNPENVEQITQTLTDEELGGQILREIGVAPAHEITDNAAGQSTNGHDGGMEIRKTLRNMFNRRRRHNIRVFSRINEMTASLKKVCTRARQRTAMLAAAQKDADGLHDPCYYQSYSNFQEELCKFFHHQSAVAVNRNNMSVIDRERLKLIDGLSTVWKTVLDVSSLDGASINPIANELNAVVVEAATWISKLRTHPTDQAGVQILELFVRDCLGQHSMEATIFTQKIQPLRDAYVMPWGLKCVAFSCLLIADLYFIFSCLLYGRNKGWEWQKGWLYTCLVNLLVDIFINSVTLASITHYFVPNLILDKARSIRTSLTRIIHDMCDDVSKSSKGTATNANKVRNAVFSSAAYFFVSAHVARAFPDLLESKIVLANRTFLLSNEQLSKVAPHYLARTERQQRESVDHNIGSGGTAMPSGWSRLLGLWITFAMLKFGSQSLSTQQAVISVLNPSIVSLIAMCGLSISERSVFGILGGVIAVGVLLISVYSAGRYFLREVRLEQAGGADESTDLSLTQREIDLFDTVGAATDTEKETSAAQQRSDAKRRKGNEHLRVAAASGRIVKRKVWFDANAVDRNQPAAPLGPRLTNVFRVESEDQVDGLYDDDDEDRDEDDHEYNNGGEDTADALLKRLRWLSSRTLENDDSEDDDEDDSDNDSRNEVSKGQCRDEGDKEFAIHEDDDEKESEPNYMTRFKSMLVPIRSPLTAAQDHQAQPIQSISVAQHNHDTEDNDEEDGLDMAEMEQIIALARLIDGKDERGDIGSDSSSLDDYAELLELGFIRDLTTVDTGVETG